MNPEPSQIARELFQRAIKDGPVEMPTAVQHVLQELSSHSAQAVPLNTAALTEQVAEQFSTWETFHSAKTLELEQTEICVNGLRWVLRELRSWTPETEQPWLRLRVLLAALGAFHAVDDGADAVLQQLTAPSLSEGLNRLLEDAAAQYIRARGEDDSKHNEVQAAGRDGNYLRLEILTQRLEVRFQPDTRLAIYLLWRTRPELLSGLINRKQDAFFSYAVSKVLADSAPEFALGVDDITFKFFGATAIAYMQSGQAPSEAVDVFCKLLLQAAKSPHWLSWLKTFYKYPKGNTVSDQALSKSLGQLEVRHWADFVSAVQLWTHRGSAEAVANILIRFYQVVEDPTAREMWLLAFRRWDQWDYGREENDNMLAPSACSFDFPVAMYYAHLPPDKIKAEEAGLIGEIACVEQKWFSSESNLSTNRNRLLSRLRLVRHGQALASGSKEALPPPVQPDGEYAKLRYRYFDVHSPQRMLKQ